MQLFLEAVPIILKLFSKVEDTYYSQIIPRIICQSLPMTMQISHMAHNII